MRLIRGDFRKKGEQLPRASELVRLCSYARNTVQPIEKYLVEHTDYDDEEIAQIVQMSHAFDERKRRNNYLDYDDILFRFAKVLHEDADVRERLRGFYDHLLVDEMQDTNPLQWMILDAMRDPARLFCVGDDAQSIYAFPRRGFSQRACFYRARARRPGSAPGRKLPLHPGDSRPGQLAAFRIVSRLRQATHEPTAGPSAGPA